MKMATGHNNPINESVNQSIIFFTSTLIFIFIYKPMLRPIHANYYERIFKSIVKTDSIAFQFAWDPLL